MVSFFLMGCQDQVTQQSQKAEETDPTYIPPHEASMGYEDFHTLNNEFAEHLPNRLHQNKEAVLRLVNEERFEKAVNYVDDYYEVPIANLKGSPAKSLAESGEGYIKVTFPDQDRIFDVSLVPHISPATLKKSVPYNNKLQSEEVFIAWDVDRFYIEEDADGKELYPVTFPVFSLEDPDFEVDVTLYRDGTLEWGGITEKNVSKNELQNSDPSLLYITTTECTTCIIPPDDGSGGGFPTFEPVTGSHLAMVSMMLGKSGDGSGNSELQMYIEENDNYSLKFSKYWGYDFKGDARDLKGSDGVYYHEPDVNQPGIRYSFANLPAGPEHYAWPQNEDYLSIIHLGTTFNRLFLADDDAVYNKFSHRTKETVVDTLSTYDFNSKSIYDIVHKISAYDMWFWETGSSDDPLDGGSLRRINEATVNDFSETEPFTIYNRGFEYKFIKKIVQ